MNYNIEELPKLSDQELKFFGVYRMLEWNYEIFLEKIKKLNTRAKKLKVEEIEIEEILIENYEHFTPEMKEAGEKPMYFKLFYIVIKGISPQIEGWEFVAKLEKYPDGNLITNISEEDLPKQYRDSDFYCDHCKSRRDRKIVYVVKNIKTGEYKQVGSTCLKDFIGGHNPEGKANFLSGLYDLLGSIYKEYLNPDFSDFNSKTPFSIDIHTFLSEIALEVRIQGRYITRKEAKIKEILSTPDAAICRILERLNPYNNQSKIEKVLSCDIALAEKIIKWILNLDQGKLDSEFLFNLFIIASGGFVDFKNKGLAGYIYQIYHNEIKEKEKREFQSDYVGEIKERKDFELFYYKSFNFSGVFGKTYIHLFYDKEGNQFKWSTNQFLGNEQEEVCAYGCYTEIVEVPYSEGTKIKLKGTIKAHEEYKGTKQTVLTRCKILNIQEEQNEK